MYINLILFLIFNIIINLFYLVYYLISLRIEVEKYCVFILLVIEFIDKCICLFTFKFKFFAIPTRLLHLDAQMKLIQIFVLRSNLLHKKGKWTNSIPQNE